jgi:hypothetical protein
MHNCELRSEERLDGPDTFKFAVNSNTCMCITIFSASYTSPTYVLYSKILRAYEIQERASQRLERLHAIITNVNIEAVLRGRDIYNATHRVRDVIPEIYLESIGP